MCTSWKRATSPCSARMPTIAPGSRNVLAVSNSRPVSRPRSTRGGISTICDVPIDTFTPPRPRTNLRSATSALRQLLEIGEPERALSALREVIESDQPVVGGAADPRAAVGEHQLEGEVRRWLAAGAHHHDLDLVRFDRALGRHGPALACGRRSR